MLDGVDLTHELVVAIKQLDGLVRPLLIAVLVNVLLQEAEGLKRFSDLGLLHFFAHPEKARLGLQNDLWREGCRATYKFKRCLTCLGRWDLHDRGCGNCPGLDIFLVVLNG